MSLSIEDFPKNFLFGTATSAYQIEGAYKTDGRNLSIWDVFSNTPNKTRYSHNGNIACDHYHRYKEDVSIISNLGFKVYRFSISWSRILPNGRLPLNPKGVEFYNNLINELLKKNIIPFVTLFHWDLPQTLQDEYNGFISPKIVKDFENYAELCFKLFGDRVKHWITFNEPFITSSSGYYEGTNPPQRCRDRKRCKEGSDLEIYLATHYQILSHAKASDIYKKKYRNIQKGVIGISLNCDWNEPYSNKPQDQASIYRYLDFQLGWFAHPIYFGDYPSIMKTRVGNRLPNFTKEESDLLKDSSDFLGLNHYTSRYMREGIDPTPGYNQDKFVIASVENEQGKPIGKLQYPRWLYSYPEGIRKLINYTYQTYKTPIYITENGVAEEDKNDRNLKDDFRIEYYRSYIREMYKAINKDKADVRGYMAWSLLDNFEWNDGYTVRFGINYVDYSNQRRFQKNSALWWKSFLQSDEKGIFYNFWKILKNIFVSMRKVLFINKKFTRHGG